MIADLIPVWRRADYSWLRSISNGRQSITNQQSKIGTSTMISSLNAGNDMTIRGALRLLILAAMAAPATTIGQTTPSWTQWAEPVATSCPTARAWLRPGRRADQRNCGAVVWRRPLRGSSEPSVLDVPGDRSRASRPSHTKKSSPPSTPRAARRSGSSNTRPPRHSIRPGLRSSQHAASSATGFAASSRSELFTSTSDRQASGRTTSGVQRAADRTRLQRRPSPLQRHHHRDDGRTESGGGGIRPGIGQAAVEERLLRGRPRRRFSSTWTNSWQLVVFGGDVVGRSVNGRELWRHPHKTDWGLNISTPLGRRPASAARVIGLWRRARARIRQSAGKTTVTESGTASGCAFTSAPSFVSANTPTPRAVTGPALISAFDLKSGAAAGPQLRARNCSTPTASSSCSTRTACSGSRRSRRKA